MRRFVPSTRSPASRSSRSTWRMAARWRRSRSTTAALASSAAATLGTSLSGTFLRTASPRSPRTTSTTTLCSSRTTPRSPASRWPRMITSASRRAPMDRRSSGISCEYEPDDTDLLSVHRLLQLICKRRRSDWYVEQWERWSSKMKTFRV